VGVSVCVTLNADASSLAFGLCSLHTAVTALAHLGAHGVCAILISQDT